jgi:hypothetical protein
VINQYVFGMDGIIFMVTIWILVLKSGMGFLFVSAKQSL